VGYGGHFLSIDLSLSLQMKQFPSSISGRKAVAPCPLLLLRLGQRANSKRLAVKRAPIDLFPS